MNWADWYTDTVDIYRVTTYKQGNLTRRERGEALYTGVPCRVYQSDSKAINMTQTAADIRQDDKLAAGRGWGGRGRTSGPSPPTPTSTMSRSGP